MRAFGAALRRTITVPDGRDFVIRALTQPEWSECFCMRHEKERFVRVLILGVVLPRITFGRDPGDGELSIFDIGEGLETLVPGILELTLAARAGRFLAAARSVTN